MVDIQKLKPQWFDYRTDIPQWILSGIGQVTAEWSVLERELEELIRLLMDVEIQHGRIIVNWMNAKTRGVTAQHLIQSNILQDKLKAHHLETFTKIAGKIWPGIAKTYELAKKYKIKTAWGTDVLFSRALAQQQGAILASLVRWYTPAEALVMATGTNAELLALSGKRNPYPGKLGVIEEGALADLLLVDGNPLDKIDLIADPANFKIIMKNGVIYKNTLTK